MNETIPRSNDESVEIILLVEKRIADAVAVERQRCAQAALSEERESARESEKEPDRQTLQGRVFAARSIYNEIVAPSENR